MMGNRFVNSYIQSPTLSPTCDWRGMVWSGRTGSPYLAKLGAESRYHGGRRIETAALRSRRPGCRVRRNGPGAAGWWAATAMLQSTLLHQLSGILADGCFPARADGGGGPWPRVVGYRRVHPRCSCFSCAGKPERLGAWCRVRPVYSCLLVKPGIGSGATVTELSRLLIPPFAWGTRLCGNPTLLSRLPYAFPRGTMLSRWRTRGCLASGSGARS